MDWRNGAVELDTGRYTPALGLLLDSAMESVAARRHSQLTESSLLTVLLETREHPLLLSLQNHDRDEYRNTVALLDNYVATGVTVSDCLAAFDVVTDVGDSEVNPFARDSWREPLPSLVETLPDGAGVPDLLTTLFEAADRLPDGDLLTSLFQVEQLLSALSLSKCERSVIASGPAEGGGSSGGAGPLDEGAFTSRAWYLLEKTLLLTARTGAQSCDPASLLVAMVQTRDTYTELILRQAGVVTTGRAAASHLATATAESRPGATPLPAAESSLAPELRALLDAALRQALATGEQAVGERQLLGALLDSPEPRLRYLVDEVLDVPTKLVKELLGEVREPEVVEPLLPMDICSCRNVTVELMRSPGTAPVGRDDLTTKIVRVLFRRKRRNVLLHGERGTGVSTMAEVLADALRRNRFPALRHMQVVVFDLAGLDGVEYARAAEKLLAFMEREPDRIYVLDGFARYFTENFEACARRFARNTYRMLVLVDQAEHVALQAGSEPLNVILDEVELAEPPADVIADIVEQAMVRIAREYGVTFSDKAAQTTIRMAGDYILSARFPVKAVSLLERAAADVAADCDLSGSGPRQVDRQALAQQVSVLTGIPVETILGTGQDKDYVDLLSTRLVGQEAAVAKVAGRLDLIQKGLVDRRAPAAVFVFAGLSGTGKTELAKQIAQLYSQTHAMISFAMENFGEAHSVSKLIGSPPGYVGFEEGGPLINALNRDPYAVVLLDEIEKAHPAVWDPFLNLFDEGTITDSRGVTASGSKAFFILTSNIGQYEISELLAGEATQAEIEEAVTGLFPRHQHEQTRQPCFRPEFIGRVMRRGGIVTFNALSYEALLGIARHEVNKIARTFAEVHHGRFVCDDDVLEMIAHTIHTENEEVIRRKRPGYLGARRIQQLLDQYVNNKLAAKIRQIASAPLVRVVRNGHDTVLVPVYSNADAEALMAQKRAQLVGRVEQRFSQVVTLPDEIFSSLTEEKLARLDRLLSEMSAIV